MKSGVFIGCPTHDGRIDQACALNLFTNSSKERPFVVAVSQGLSVTPASNALWSDALNARDAVSGVDCPGIGWFAMLHSDIDPGSQWVDKLIFEAEAHDADLVSAIVPIKSEDGLTSTALTDPGDPYRNWCRLTMRQVNHESFPVTFDAEMACEALAVLPGDLADYPPEGSRLLVNTGCFVARVDRLWCDQVWFEQFDGIAKLDGKWQMVALSEDWTFSKKVAEHGGRVMATKAVNLKHRGYFEWPSWAMNFGKAQDPVRSNGKVGRVTLMGVS